MVALPAQLLFPDAQADSRRADRRQFRCFVEARGANGELRATIENISRTGILIDTPDALREGETIAIELPNAGATAAKVVWTYGTLAGCELLKPLSQGAVSAALHFSPHLLPPREVVLIGGAGIEKGAKRAGQDWAVATTGAWFVLALTAVMLLSTLILQSFG